MRRVPLLAALVVAAVAGGAIATAVRPGAPASTVLPPAPPTTAPVVRTDLASTVLTGGMLGYGPSDPVVNQLTGTYTQLPAAGATVAAGQVLYRVDNVPVVLMTGAVPAWRPFSPGMTDGPDVVELQANLIALGDARGLLSKPSGRFDPRTVGAVERWQVAVGDPATGRIALGEVVFLPSFVIVGAPSTAPGQTAAPGALPFQVTTTTRVVTVPLSPNLPTVSVGELVAIVLPTEATTPGRITAVVPVPPSGFAPSQASSVATVTPEQPAATGSGAGVAVQVSLAIQSASGVLAVPVSALLALAGGGYGVEVVEPSGSHRLVGVTTGVFASTQVEVRGAGIAPGTRVVVAQ